jgi:hypothetical protein
MMEVAAPRTILLCALTGLAVAVASSDAATIVRDIGFEDPVVTSGAATSQVAVEGVPTYGNPGQPVLPCYALRVLLPQGEDVADVRVRVHDEKETVLDRPIMWGQPQVPRSMGESQDFIMPDPDIYENREPFPPQRTVHVTTQTLRGYNIAFFRVYPVTYAGAQRKILHSRHLEVAITTSPSEEALVRSKGTLRSGSAADLDAVDRLVGDLSAASSYGRAKDPSAMSGLVDPAESYPYVIITNSTLKPVFQALKDHKDSLGLLARIVLISEVTLNYEGVDLPERIRKFIRDAYLNWETEYVLLGGDDGIITHRGLYAEILPYVTDRDIPGDIYFACLDGTWNDDLDPRWGEPGEDDLLPEVSVGRASVETVTEATNFVNKIIRYESAPVVGQIKTAQMAGELIYDEPTWGGDEKDEIKDGTSNHGFTTVGFPPSFTVHTLYDRDLYPAEWSKYDLIALMNGGRHIINHAGHCINWMCMKISTSDIPGSFTNDGITNTYFVIYAHGCYSAAFDNRTTDGSYVGDAVAEYFTYIENGAVAYIGNSRYGCGFHGDTRSAAQYYDRQFFDALFGEGITAIGDVQNDSKVDNIPYIDFRGMRWTYYTLNLMADPAMDIWTDTPGNLAITLPTAVHIDANEVEIGVTDGTDPVAGARVTIVRDSTFAVHGFTDQNGMVYLDPAVAEPGSLYIVATAHNFYPASGTVPVAACAAPLVMLESFTIDDDTSGSSSGNSNGAADAGETIETKTSLANVGQATAESVSGLLRSSDAYVTLIDSTGTYAPIPPGATVHPGWSYVYALAPTVPDSHPVAFDLQVAYSDTSVIRHFTVPVRAPVLAVSGLSGNDSLYGNGDGCVEAGEIVEFTLEISNSGSGDAAGIAVTLAESDPYAALEIDSAFVASVAAGGEAETSPAFRIVLAPDCPRYHSVDLDADIDLAGGIHLVDSTIIHVGGALSDDLEGEDLGWTHADIVPGFLDQWHLDTYRNHTPGGSISWKFGGAGSEPYAHYAHGGLVTPELCLGSNASMSFWHWIQVELESGNYASDGGIVEISVDGGSTWTQITPSGGYPHRIYPGTSTPIPPETPCFAWTSDWAHVQFDLSAYQGRARIRFNFGGGEHFGTEEGWYIDDIVVTDDFASVAIDDDELVPLPTEFALCPIMPNPVMSGATVVFDVPRPSHVSVAAFDIRGRKVDTVAQGAFAPGRHTARWQPREVAPGVYFIRLEAMGFSQTRKVVLN